MAEALKLAESRIRPGLQAIDLDAEIAEFIYSKGARPAFKGYHNYPANICVSIDDQVVHGIPGQRAFKEGEIVSVDVGVELNGFYGDAAATYPVGQISEEKKRLMQITKEALIKGIEAAREGNRLYDISYAVQSHVEAAGFSIVRDLVGHGIGRSLQEAPQIPNYGEPNKGIRLRAGMVFAIEPMVNMGSWEVRTEPDDWTVVTIDGLPSAHYEHTIALTNGRPEILTEGI